MRIFAQFFSLYPLIYFEEAMQIDRVHFYVKNAKKCRDWFVRVMGYQSLASGCNSHTHTEVVSSGTKKVVFVLSSPLTSASPVTKYLEKHPSGVVDVAFAVTNLATILEKAIASGAEVIQPIKQWKSSQGQLKWCQIKSLVGLTHTLVERQGKTPLLPDEWIVEKTPIFEGENYFLGIDHIVLNVAAGQLKPTIHWYEKTLGFQKKQTFTIQTEQSGLYSQVMVHPDSGTQFPINEPLSANSQIQEFLELNQGAGIQHIALKTTQILEATKNLRSAGLLFLEVPQNYYDLIRQQHPQLNFSRQEWQEIIEREILVDLEENNLEELANYPLLLQIFTQPIFEVPTFFFELIERRDRARGFGEGNFLALFKAIEREQIKRGSLKGKR